MSHFRFIHTADIHLGSLLHIDSPDQEMVAYAREAVYDAFERLCIGAIDQGVDFLLLAGDLYDSDSKNVFANQFFIQMCRMLGDRGINLYVIAGNHDPLNKQWEYFKLPDNVFVFPADKHQVYKIKREGQTLARLVGQSYKTKWVSKPVYEEFDMPGDGIFNIAMLHTQLDPSDKKYTPATATQLMKNPHIHYWALGHVHKPEIVNSQGPVIAYPGIPQGRDFGEQGLGGAYLVEVDRSGNASMTYMVTSPVIYTSIEIDISSEDLRAAGSLDELEDYILDRARGLAAFEANKLLVDLPAITSKGGSQDTQGYVVRWIIRGRGELHKLLRDLSDDAESDLAQGLRKRLSGLSPFVWTDSIQIRTAMPITKDILSDHSRIIDMLDQTMAALLQDEEEANSLKAKMGGLWTSHEDPEDKDDLKFYLDDETFKVMGQHAKQLILEKLIDGVGE